MLVVMRGQCWRDREIELSYSPGVTALWGWIGLRALPLPDMAC